MFPTSCNPGDFVGAKGRSSGEKVEFDYGYDENMDNNMQIVNVKDENGTSTNAWKDQNEKYGWGWEDGCMTARGCSRSTIDDYSTSYLNSSNEENQGNHNKERDTNPGKKSMM